MLDRQRVLVTEAEARIIETEWNQVIWRQNLLGPEYAGLSDEEVWTRCNQQLLEAAKNDKWGLYRNVRLKMAQLLHLRGQFKDALETYLEVCYLDLNGPTNVAESKGAMRSARDCAFSKRQAFLAPAVLDWASEIASDLGMSASNLEKAFVEVARAQQQHLHLPVSTQEGWRKLSSEIEPRRRAKAGYTK